METAEVRAARLRLRWPLGITFAVAALFAAGVAGVCETVSRQARFAPESIGSGQPQLDKKLVLLRSMIEREGGLDCLFLGSSQVYRAIDPAIVAPAFRGAAGRDLRMFNFGLGGMSETGEAPLARILVAKYRPRVIVVGASSYGLDERRDLKFQKYLASSAWFRYHVGRPSLDGWLLEHSVAFRQYHGHLFWSDPTPEKEGTFKRSVQNMADDGYGWLDVGDFRAIDDAAAKDLGDFHVSPAHLGALEALLDLRAPGLEFVVVEMPVHESVIRLMGHGEADHREALDAIERVAARHGVTFWRFPPDRAIPPGAWSDFVHLNRAGAAIYSRWLGERLGEAVRDGRLAVPRA